jgi:alcohol dehydrogenase class IV
VRQLITDIDLPTRLQDVGVSEGLIPDMAASAYINDSSWLSNPRPIDQETMEALYWQAF